MSAVPESITTIDRELHSNVVNAMNASLKEATVSVSFWGARLVSVDGEQTSLNDLIKSKIDVLNNLPKDANGKADLTLDGRVAALSVLEQLKGLKDKTDEAVKASNIFTRVMASLRSFIFGTAQISVAGLNPFNQGTTQLELVRKKLNLSDEEYSKEQAIQDLQPYRALLAHAVWEAAGAPRFDCAYDFGGVTIDTDPKGDLVKTAIDARLLAFPTLARFNLEGVQAQVPVAFV